jgi:hypothetical protein
MVPSDPSGKEKIGRGMSFQSSTVAATSMAFATSPRSSGPNTIALIAKSPMTRKVDTFSPAAKDAGVAGRWVSVGELVQLISMLGGDKSAVFFY